MLEVGKNTLITSFLRMKGPNLISNFWPWLKCGKRKRKLNRNRKQKPPHRKRKWRKNQIQVNFVKTPRLFQKNCIFLSKLFWPTVRKNCPSDQEKLLKFEAEGQEFAKIYEITRAIYSSSERSEQFVVTECFFNSFLEISQIW